MSKFNFDSEFFRRVIAKCEASEKIPPLSRMVSQAVEMFYDEYDYYPDLAVYAPGTFTIMGDHLEYVKGNLVQAALPIGTVVVGKSLHSVKCKLYTSSKSVDGLKKSVFPISHYKKNLKVFPEWVNYIKGIINVFPDRDIRGFNSVIHSNVPFSQGYGSSAALQVGFFTFLEAILNENPSQKKAAKGNLCYLSETQLGFCNNKLGFYNNFTSAVAVANNAVRVNCRTRDVSVIEMRDINILFLLTYPKFEIEVKDRDLVKWRKMELQVAAKLLGLSEIIDATEYHLHVLETREDPSKEEVKEILRSLRIDEETIIKFVEDLFYFPKAKTISEYFYGESDVNDLNLEDQEENQGEEFGESVKGESEKSEEKAQSGLFPCKKKENQKIPVSKPPTVSYIQQRLAEICAGKVNSGTISSERICEEINCLGGLDNLSAASDLTVCGKLLRRVRHIVTENMRSLNLSDVTTQVQYEEFGVKLIQSHLSLKLDYEVSSPELDGLVQLAIDSDRVYGAKMTSGGGTITLLHKSVAEKFIETVKEKFGDSYQFYLVFPSSGARQLDTGIRNNPKSCLSEVLLNRDQLLTRAIENFEINYKYRPTHGAYSPGVISLLGDFTDFNHGFCLSVAVNMMTIVVGAFNGTAKIRAVTTADVENEKRRIIFSTPDCENIKPGKVKWGKLVKGVAASYKGFINGFDCLIDSTLSRGCGISSKSALTTAFFTFLEVLNNEQTISTEEKSYRCMLAVQEFTNILHGISEYIVASKSKEDFAVFVDCRTTVSNLIPFEDPSVTLLITFVELNVKLNKALLFKRMEECYDVAKALGRRTLRCLTFKDLDGLKYCEKEVPERNVKRAIHIITENERVFKAAEALKNHDYETLGEIMVASHISLRDKYEVVHPELDRLVTCAMEVDGVFGSKMPSGYFSGIISLLYCDNKLTITGFVALPVKAANKELNPTEGTNGIYKKQKLQVKRWAVDDLIEYLQKNTSRKLTSYLVNPSDGCGGLNMKEHLDRLPSPQFAFEHIFPF